MSDRTATLLGRITAREALTAAHALAGEDPGQSVRTWRVGPNVETGHITVDGQLANNAPHDIADWADVLERSRVETRRVPGIPFGTLAVHGEYDGVPVRIWTAITRTAEDAA